MGKPVHDLSAQVQTDTCGSFVRATVIAGIPALKDPRKIFRCYPDTGIFDHQRLRALWIHINFYLSLPGVFQGVRENLFKDKFQPFFIGKYLTMDILILQCDLSTDKQRCVFSYCLMDQIVQFLFFKYQIRVHPFHPQIL